MAQFVTPKAVLTYDSSTVYSNEELFSISETLSLDVYTQVTKYKTGDMITYIIFIKNSDPTTDIYDLRVSSNMGAYSFSDTTLKPLVWDNKKIRIYTSYGRYHIFDVRENPFTISPLNLLADSTMKILYHTFVNHYAPLAPDAQIENIFTLSDKDNNVLDTESNIITCDTSTNLKIYQNMDDYTILPEKQMKFYFTIVNSGAAADRNANVVFKDYFPPDFNIIYVKFNNTDWSNYYHYHYNKSSGFFITADSQITVDAAEYKQDPDTGIWTIAPQKSTLEICGYL
ncbi:MAG: hypothetical protein Q4F95_03345 [Oscillospiraceae bacterium]|nr:hypothetical protein [Oscillospiraceae bacterium]